MNRKTHWVVATGCLCAMGLAGTAGCRQWAGSSDQTEVTQIEVLIDSDLGAGAAYAKNIAFDNPAVRVNPEDDDELLIELDVINNGSREVTELNIWADFYNSNGLKVADEGELLAHNMGLGDNSSPVPANGRKRAIIELDSPEGWTGGKMVITIRELQTKSER